MFDKQTDDLCYISSCSVFLLIGVLRIRSQYSITTRLENEVLVLSYRYRELWLSTYREHWLIVARNK